MPTDHTDKHRSTKRTQRRDTEPPIQFLTQRRKGAKPTQEARRSRRSRRFAQRRQRGGPESPRDFIAWRGPGRRATARNRRTGQPLRMHAFDAVALSSGLRSESAGPATPSLHFMVGRGTHLSPTEKTGGGTAAPLARRPVGSQVATNARVRSKLTFHRLPAIE